MCTYIYKCVYVCTYIGVCACVNIYIRVCVCVCVYIERGRKREISIYIYKIYVYIYIYIYIDKCDILNKDKVWCIYFGLIPKLSWPMQLYEVSLTKVKTMEQLNIQKVVGST